MATLLSMNTAWLPIVGLTGRFLDYPASYAGRRFHGFLVFQKEKVDIKRGLVFRQPFCLFFTGIIRFYCVKSVCYKFSDIFSVF